MNRAAVFVIVVELGLAVLGLLAFAAMYALRSRWRETEIGRHVMAFTLVTAAEVGSLLALGLGVPVPLWLFAVGFGALDVVIAQRLWLLAKVQHQEAPPG